MAKFRQEINILNGTLATSSTSVEQVQLDTSKFGGTVTYYFEVVTAASSASTDSVTLTRQGTTTNDATISLAGTGAGVAVRSGSFTPPANAATKYVVKTGANHTIKAARIIIIQDSGSYTINATQIHIEIGNKETGKTNSTAAALVSPKYWTYKAKNWDIGFTFQAHVTYQTSSTNTTTITLQEDDGAFGVWADKVTLVSALSSTAGALSALVAFTPVEGKSYRISGRSSTSKSTWSLHTAKIVATSYNQVNDTTAATGYFGATADETYAYFSHSDTPASVTRVSKSNWTTISKVAFATGGNAAYNITNDANYVYATNYTTAARIQRIHKSDWTTIDTLTLGTGLNNAAHIGQDDTYVYALLDLNPAQVVRILKSNFTYVDSLTFSAQPGAGGFHVDADYVYVVSGANPNSSLSRVPKSNWTTGAITTLSMTNIQDVISMNGDQSYVYVGLNTNVQSTGRITRVSKSTFTVIGTVDFSAVSSPTGSSVSSIAVDAQYIYAALGATSGAGMIGYVDAATFTVVRGVTMPVATAARSITSDGSRIYVGNAANPENYLVLPGAQDVMKFESQYLLLNTKSTATGLQAFPTQFDPAEWTDYNNLYYHAQDAIGAAANAKLQDTSNANADIANSSITGANEQLSSSALVMPAASHILDTNIVAIGTEVDASKIIAIATAHLEMATFVRANIGGKPTAARANITRPSISRWGHFDGAASGSFFSSTTFTDLTSTSFTPEPNSTYVILASWKQRNATNTITSPTQVRLQRTSGGTTTIAQTYVTQTNGAQTIPGGALAVETSGPSPSPVIYTIQAALVSGTDQMDMFPVKIAALKLGTHDQTLESLARQTTTTTGSYTDAATLTFTPSTAGNYLLFVSGQLDITTNTDSMMAQMTIDGTGYGAVKMRPQAANDIYTYIFMEPQVLSTASHTIKIQYQTSNASATVGIQNSRILALRVDDYYYEDEVDTDTRLTSTSNSNADSALLNHVNYPANTNTLVITNAILDYSDVSANFAGNWGQTIDGQSHSMDIKQNFTTDAFSYMDLNMYNGRTANPVMKQTVNVAQNGVQTVGYAYSHTVALVITGVPTQDNNAKALLGTSTESYFKSTGVSSFNSTTLTIGFTNGFTPSQYAAVASQDGTLVQAIGSSGLSAFGFMNMNVEHDNTQQFTTRWYGKSSGTANVTMEIYNFNSSTWENISTVTPTANTPFEIKGDFTASVSNYYSSRNEVVTRIYQDGGFFGVTLSTDYYDVWWQKGQSAKANIGASGPASTSQNTSAKANVVVTTSQNTSARADIKVTATQGTSVKANIVATTTQATSAKANVLVINNTQAESAKANILVTGNTQNTSTKADIKFTNTKDTYALANLLTAITQANSAKANILVVNNTKDESVKASIVVTNAFGISAKANLVATTSKDNSAKADILSPGQQATYAKANILQVNNLQANSSKANILVINQQANSVIANIEGVKGLFVKANILVATSQNQNAKADILVTQIQATSVKANILLTGNLKANSAKADILVTALQNNSVKANLLVTLAQNNSVKANVLVAGTLQGESAKANVLVINNTQAESAKADIVVTTSQNTSAKANIEGVLSQSVKANILATQTQNNSAKANLLVTAIQAESVKANLLVTTGQAQSTKANILATLSKDNSVKADIDVTDQFATYAKANILVTQTQAVSVKADILVTTTQPNSVKANIEGVFSQSVKSNILVIQSQATSVKANILATLTQQNSVKANVLVILSQAESTKANILTGNTQGQSVKANIVSTTAQGTSVKANLLVTTVQNQSVKANIYELGTKGVSAKANILATLTKDNSAKASISTLGQQAEYAKADILTTLTQGESSKADILTTVSQDNNVKANIVGVKAVFAKADILSVQTQDESVKANIVGSTTSDTAVKANILSPLTQNQSAKANVLVTNNVQNQSAKADILVIGGATTQITQVINMLVGGGWNATSGANVFQELAGIATRLNMADFDGSVTVYFEANLYTSQPGHTTTAELYNHTDSQTVSGSTLTSTNNTGTAERKRSGPITLSGDKIYTVRLKNDLSGVTGFIYAARLIVVQLGVITKTQIHIDLGNEENNLSATSNTNRVGGGSRFLYEATKYNGTVSIRHDALLQAPSGQTVTSGIYDETATAIVTSSEVSSSSSGTSQMSGGQLVSSSAITLTDGHVYRPTSYVSGGTTGWTESNKIVITLTGNPTKFLAMWEQMSSRVDSTTSTSYIYENDHNLLWDTNDFSNTLVTYYFEADLSISNASETATAILDDVDTQTNFDQSLVTATGSTSLQRVRSGAVTPPSSAKQLGSGIKTSNASATAQFYNTYLVIEAVMSPSNGLSTSVKANILAPVQQGQSVKANVLATSTKDTYALASIKGSGQAPQYVKANILVTGNTQAESAKADILATTSQGESVKANIMAAVSQSAKANILVISSQNESVKADILFTLTQALSVKANLLSTTVQAESVKADILVLGTTDNQSVKANIVAASSQNESVKANIKVTTTQDESAKANLVATTSKDESVKADIKVAGQQATYAKANILVLGNTQNESVKANIVVTTSQGESVKADILKTLSQGESVQANISGAGQAAFYAKANILVVGIKQNESAKADVLVLGNTQNESTKANILSQTIKGTSTKADILASGQVPTYAKANILTTNLVQNNSVKADIDSVGTLQGQSAKANILATAIPATSAKADIVAVITQATYALANIKGVTSTTTQANSAKANILVTGNTDAVSTKVDILVTATQALSVKANILASETWATSNKANLLVTQVQGQSAKADIEVIAEGYSLFVKASIKVTQIDNLFTKSNILSTQLIDGAVKANIKGGIVNLFTKANIRVTAVIGQLTKANIQSNNQSQDMLARAHLRHATIYLDDPSQSHNRDVYHYPHSPYTTPSGVYNTKLAVKQGKTNPYHDRK